jgi:maltose alpha-D-glucosyltransferase/alpha-amylase
MQEWLERAVVYAMDLASFCDGTGNGTGDLRGATARLEHIRSLGADAVWVGPMYPSPRWDDGYDVADHLAIDPAFGDDADFDAFVERAGALGIRVVLDLVVNHTSDDHPWYLDARQDPTSRYRRYYVFRDEPDPTFDARPAFPGVNDNAWTYDEVAGAWRLARFYAHEPELDNGNPEVIDEVERILSHWISRGVSGFRIDAAPYIVSKVSRWDATDNGHWLWRRLTAHVRGIDPEIALMGEADVPVQSYDDYFLGGDGIDGILDFAFNKELFLALAREDAWPLVERLHGRHGRQQGTLGRWVRNHDELDLDDMSQEDVDCIRAAFGCGDDTFVYGRGIRRRWPPMARDARQLFLAYAVVCSVPGAPIIRYGEEIGMGDDLRQPERLAVRTAMQWTGAPDAGYSSAPRSEWMRPLIDDGPFGNQRVNVADEERDDSSLLQQMRRLLDARLEVPEVSQEICHLLDTGNEAVLGIAYHGDGEVLILHNFGRTPVRQAVPAGEWREVFPRRDARHRGAVPLDPYGTAWLRS